MTEAPLPKEMLLFSRVGFFKGINTLLNMG